MSKPVHWILWIFAAILLVITALSGVMAFLIPELLKLWCDTYWPYFAALCISTLMAILAVWLWELKP